MIDFYQKNVHQNALIATVFRAIRNREDLSRLHELINADDAEAVIEQAQKDIEYWKKALQEEEEQKLFAEWKAQQEAVA